MAFTLEQIEHYYKEIEQKCELDYKKEEITTRISPKRGHGIITINALENGEVFSLTIEPFNETYTDPFYIPTDHPHNHLVLKQLWLFNLQSDFGTWKYDSSDGSLFYSLCFPIGDSMLSFKQFKRAWSIFLNALEELIIIKEILETGTIPEKSIETQEKTLGLSEKQLRRSMGIILDSLEEMKFIQEKLDEAKMRTDDDKAIKMLMIQLQKFFLSVY